MFTLSSQPLDPVTLKTGLACPQAGAFVSFEGWVRDHHDGRAVVGIDYEAYDELCSPEGALIMEEARRQFGVLDAVCVHRVGQLKVGDLAVWVGVVAGHRGEAFRACRFVIDEIKRRLPIWKKEHYASGGSEWVNCQTAPSSDEAAFYSRQTILPSFGPESQEKLRNSSVLVVGAGGLGSAALLSLAQAGFGTVGICESDTLEISNLHRQSLYSIQDVGMLKAALAEDRLKAINPFITIRRHPVRLTAQNAAEILRPYSVILDCTDNFAAKFLLNDACFLFKLPLVQASIYQFEGQLRTMIPGVSGCLRCLWPSPPSEDCVADCARAGVLGVVPNILGHWQALEAVKIASGFARPLDEHTLVIDLAGGAVTRLFQPRDPSCPLCGDQATITSLFGDPLDKECVDLRRDTADGARFVDVREEHELSASPSRLKDGLHLPMSRIERLEKSDIPFDRTTRYLLFCEKGARSRRMTGKLRQWGFDNVFSIEGGVEAVRAYAQTHKDL